MPTFRYTGRAAGAAVEGTLEGASAAAVADILAGRGVTPLEIRPLAGNGGTAVIDGLLRRRLLDVDVMLFSRQLHALLKAGVPILRALIGLQESSVKPQMKEMLQDIRDNLDAGRELSASMARHPRAFSGFYLAMVRVGEMTGRLEEIFLSLFEHLEFERMMRGQVKSALRYPAFVVFAILVAMFVVNVFVIPAFARVYKGFAAELPLLTRALLAVSDFVVAGWPLLLGGMAAAVVGFRSFIGTAPGRLWWDRIKLSIPIAGKIVTKATLARFARSFSLSLKSGVPILQSLSTVAQTVDNAHVSRKVEGMRHGVERGESLTRAGHASGIFTPVVLQMIAVGEESGALDDMMQEIAEMYQHEVEYELKTLAQQIEPVLIVILGALVLVLALGIFLPIWDLSQAALAK